MDRLIHVLGDCPADLPEPLEEKLSTIEELVNNAAKVEINKKQMSTLNKKFDKFIANPTDSHYDTLVTYLENIIDPPEPKTKDKDINTDIINFDNVINPNKAEDEDVLAPKHPFRLMICGAAGSGKTNFLLNLLTKLLEYDKIYIYTKTPHQDKYQFLKTYYETIEQDPELKDMLDLPICYMEDSLDKMIPVQQCDSAFKNVIVFDDLVSEPNQKPMIDAFIHGRHSNASCIYLTQSYFTVPTDIRKQCSHFAFFESPTQNDEQQIIKDHVRDLSKEDFKQYFKDATAGDHSFAYIDKTAKNKALRYRRNYNELLID